MDDGRLPSASIAIKFDLPPRLPRDTIEANSLYFEAVQKVAHAAEMLRAYAALPDLARPSIACSPDLYHRLNTMRYGDTDRSVAEVILSHAPNVGAIVGEYGPPTRELEQVYLQRADLEKQALALRHVLINERKAHVEERTMLRTALENCLEAVTADVDPWEYVGRACEAAGLAHGGYNDGEPIYKWEKP